MLKRRERAAHSSTPEDAAVAHRKAIHRNADLADALVQYALEVGESPGDQLFPADASALAYLASEDGRTAVQRWASAFKGSLSLVEAFRNQLLYDPGSVTDADVAEAALASEEMLDALKRRISRRAHAA